MRTFNHAKQIELGIRIACKLSCIDSLYHCLDSSHSHIEELSRVHWNNGYGYVVGSEPKKIQFNLNARDKGGNTALHTCAQEDFVEGILVLCSLGASTEIKNSRGDTPLQLASFYSHTDAVIALLACGANVDVQNRSQETPLHYATRSMKMRLLEVVLDARPLINVRNVYGHSPIDIAQMTINKRAYDLLVAHGADTTSYRSAGLPNGMIKHRMRFAETRRAN